MSTVSKKIDAAVRPARGATASRSGPAVASQTVALTTAVWPAADVSMSMLAVVEKRAHKHLEAGDTWRRRAADLGGDFLETIDHYGKETWINLLGLPYDIPAARTGAGFAETVGTMDPTELVRYLSGYFRRVFRRETPAAVMDEAIAGDRAARREFRRTSFPDEVAWRDTLRHLLARDPDEIRDEFADLIRTWQTRVYGPLEAESVATMARSLQTFVAAIEGLPLEQIVDRAVPGVTFVPEAGQTEVILNPSLAVRPLWAVTDHRTANVFAFPAPAEAGEHVEPPSRLVALGKAIGDETRLRILRELATQPATPPDLADRMGIPRTSLLHHLRILREADLIAVQVHDTAYHQYHVRDEHFGEIERLLESYLG